MSGLRRIEYNAGTAALSFYSAKVQVMRDLDKTGSTYTYFYAEIVNGSPKICNDNVGAPFYLLMANWWVGWYRDMAVVVCIIN